MSLVLALFCIFTDIILSQPGCPNGTTHTRNTRASEGRGAGIHARHTDPDEPIPVLVIACNRVDYVKQTLDNLLQ